MLEVLVLASPGEEALGSTRFVAILQFLTIFNFLCENEKRKGYRKKGKEAEEQGKFQLVSRGMN